MGWEIGERSRIVLRGFQRLRCGCLIRGRLGGDVLDLFLPNSSLEIGEDR